MHKGGGCISTVVRMHFLSHSDAKKERVRAVSASKISRVWCCIALLAFFPQICSSFVAPSMLIRQHNVGHTDAAPERVKPTVGLCPTSFGTAGSSQEGSAGDIATLEDVEEAAKRCGMYITMTWLGPVYRAVIRLQPKDGEEKGKAIGYTTGSIIGGLIRQDTMRISFVNSGNELSKKRPDEMEGRGWKSPSVFGLSVLLGAYPLRYAYDKGCKTAQLLAIFDEERQYKVLRRHYKRLGLKPIKELTDDISFIPDRMLWGGTGTLMEADVKEILSRHTAELRRIGM